MSEVADFGTGSFVGNIQVQDDGAFFGKSAYDQALELGWANGCPVARELSDPANTEPGRGPEAMVKRYGEVNFLHGHIVRTIAEVSPRLAEQFKMPTPRQPYELVGDYEPTSVPLPDYLTLMAPMGRLEGFVAPRLFSAAYQASLDESGQPNPTFFIALTDWVETAACDIDSPMDFLAAFAERLCCGALPVEDILKISLSQGWLAEHGAHTMMQDYKDAILRKAPSVWRYYETLSDKEKADLGIV